jgi:hypothetical protein
MTTNTPQTSLETQLKRISKLMQSWPGAPLGEYGTLRVLNAQGSKPPIFWCFNGAGKFPALAHELGPDQPLVGMRSLNQVLEVTAITPKESRALGEYYAGQLFEIFGTAECIIGGNCQAAPIMHAAALWMKLRATQVLHFVTLDAQLHRPYPGELRMLFGRNSASYNPYFGKTIDLDTAPALNWRYAITAVKPEIIGGGHGEYFSPDNITSLAQAISRPSTVPSLNSAMTKLPIWKVVDNDENHLVISSPKAKCENHDFAIVPIWEQDGEQLRLLDDDWITYPKDVGKDYICKIKKPEVKDGWLLRLVICQRDIGPCIWPLAAFQTISIHDLDNYSASKLKLLIKSKFMFALRYLTCKK